MLSLPRMLFLILISFYAANKSGSRLLKVAFAVGDLILLDLLIWLSDVASLLAEDLAPTWDMLCEVSFRLNGFLCTNVLFLF